MGLRILGWRGRVLGVDLDPGACATGRAAGFERLHADVSDLDPESSLFRSVTGVIITPPCPPFSAAGKGSGRADLGKLRTAVERLADANCYPGIDDAWLEHLAEVADPRTVLVMQAALWTLRLPRLRWLVCEQVPAVEGLWQELCAELAMVAGWASCQVVRVAADDLGLASRRTRVFVIAHRWEHRPLGPLPIRGGWACGKFQPPLDYGVSGAPAELAALGGISMARALGWPSGHRVNTRGVRRTSGGNEFSADAPSWCLTEKARTWKRVADGERLTEAQAGLLMGFPADYPWSGPSRSRNFLQVADAVAPPVAAAVLGVALGQPWLPQVMAYLQAIYPPLLAEIVQIPSRPTRNDAASFEVAS